MRKGRTCSVKWEGGIVEDGEDEKTTRGMSGYAGLITCWILKGKGLLIICSDTKKIFATEQVRAIIG